jgi:hypothetical protein
MAYFVEPVVEQQTFSVGVIDTVVVPSLDARGHDVVLLTVTNQSATETLNGAADSSPNGTSQWAEVPDGSFESMGPGVTRTMKLESSQHLFVRLRLSFVGAPDIAVVTVTRLRAAARRT